jgi:hypothetical protein
VLRGGSGDVDKHNDEEEASQPFLVKFTKIAEDQDPLSMAGMGDDDATIRPAIRIATLSSQRVPVVMNPDGSISKSNVAPRASALGPIDDEDAELHHPTVAAPVSEGVPSAYGGDNPAALHPPPQLADTPVDPEALAETTITKRPLDDERPTDIEELTEKRGLDLDDEGHLVGGLSREDVWALIRRFDKVGEVASCSTMSFTYALSLNCLLI